MQQDDELKLVETCVMVTRDELESVLNAEGNLRTSKVHILLPSLLSLEHISSNMFIPFSHVWRTRRDNRFCYPRRLQGGKSMKSLQCSMETMKRVNLQRVHVQLYRMITRNYCFLIYLSLSGKFSKYKEWLSCVDTRPTLQMFHPLLSPYEGDWDVVLHALEYLVCYHNYFPMMFNVPFPKFTPPPHFVFQLEIKSNTERSLSFIMQIWTST